MSDTTNQFSVERGYFTVIYYNHNDKIIHVSTNLKGANPEDAIDKGIRNHMPKEKRLDVTHAVAFRQWEAQRRTVAVDHDYRINEFIEATA